VVAEWFGKRIPLAIRIQTEALRQRFVWLSRTQATSRSEGWEITDVERKIELPIGDALMVAKIDRIDRHSDSGQLRVIDYKTGKVDGVEKSHRKRLIASSTIPMHLSQDCPAIYRDSASAKPADFLWHNLQLPLYASALVADGLTLPEPCYFTLRSTESEVAIHTWDNFENADLEAARSCAEWVAGQIAAAVFWPPAEKVTYDDFEVLAAGRNFEEMFDHG
jgi:ATP-dependent helicase/nuclease subunit B